MRKRLMCTHEIVTQKYEEVFDYYGESTNEHEWVTTRTSTCEDIDLHRFHCTQCKQVMYYSARAADFYERGIKSEILGLV